MRVHERKYLALERIGRIAAKKHIATGEPIVSMRFKWPRVYSTSADKCLVSSFIGGARRYLLDSGARYTKYPVLPIVSDSECLLVFAENLDSGYCGTPFRLAQQIALTLPGGRVEY